MDQQFSELIFSETAVGATVVVTKRSNYLSTSNKPVSILLASQVDQTAIPIPDRNAPGFTIMNQDSPSKSR